MQDLIFYRCAKHEVRYPSGSMCPGCVQQDWQKLAEHSRKFIPLAEWVELSPLERELVELLHGRAKCPSF